MATSKKSPPGKSRRPLLTWDEAAAYLGTNADHLRQIVYMPGLTYKSPRRVKVGGQVRFDPDDLDAWVDENKLDGSG